MTIPTNFKHNTLYPIVTIKNENGSVMYSHTSAKLDSTAQRDFNISDLNLRLGINDQWGSLVLVIPDHAFALTDTSSTNRKCLIEREWEITLDLCTSLTNKLRYFHGKIKDATIQREGTNQQQIILTCAGWGVILKERMTRLVRNQDKDTDGVTLDDTDTKTTLSELILDLFQDDDHLVDPNLGNISTITAQTSTTGEGINEDETSIKIANINFNIATYAQAIATFSTIANTVYRVDENRRLIVHDPNSHDSGFLLSNDMTDGGTTGNWDGDKVAYLLNTPVSWGDNSVNSYYSFIHGFGHFSPALTTSLETAPDAADNLDTAWHAIPFTSNEDNIFKIAIRSIKTGTPASDGKVEIWGDSGGSGPDPNDIRWSKIFNKELLQSLGTTTPATWLEIPVKPRLDITPDEQLYIIFKKYGTATDTYSVNYKSGTGTFWDSSDGVTWTSRVGASAFRIYNARRLLTTLEIIDTENELDSPREHLFPIRSDLEEQTVRQTMLGVGDILSREKRVYDNIRVSVPFDKLPVGYSCRIIERQSGLDVYGVITSLQCQATSSGSDIGVDFFTLGVESYEF